MFESWFDIRSGHLYFQGQYFLYFSPFVCSIFLAIFIALVVFVFNPFLFILFLQPLPGFQSYKGVQFPVGLPARKTAPSRRVFSYIVLTVPLYLSGCNSLISAFILLMDPVSGTFAGFGFFSILFERL